MKIPTYTYECQKCGRTFEAQHSITAAPLATCYAVPNEGAPTCKGKLKRIIQQVGIAFKGPGFFSTDNPKK